MGITKGTGVATSGNLTTGFTLVVPAAVALNDFVICAITNRDATANPTCVDNEGAGTWARLTTVNATTNGSISLWWKRASANTASKTVTVGGCTGSASGALFYYRGVTLAAVPFGTPVGEGNASGNETQAGITTARDGSLVIHLVGCTSNDTLAPGNRTATSPTTITEDVEGVSSGGSDCSMSIASDVKASAGATGTITWAQTDGTGASLAVELYAAYDNLTATTANVPITGTDAALKYHRRVTADSGAVAITGTAATLGRKITLVATAGAIAITGTDATLTYVPITGYTLTADAGDVPITGTSAELRYHRNLTADAGAVPITGTDASLERGLEVAADSGNVPITGTDATLRRVITLVAAAGNLPITGTDADLRYNRRGASAAGAVPITGTDAALRVNLRLPASSGNVPIAGTDATLTYIPAGQYSLTATSGSVPITGTDASLRVMRQIAAEAGAVPITGTAAALAVISPAESGNVPITGTDAGLYYHRRLDLEAGNIPITAGPDVAFGISDASVITVPHFDPTPPIVSVEVSYVRSSGPTAGGAGDFMGLGRRRTRPRGGT